MAADLIVLRAAPGVDPAQLGRWEGWWMDRADATAMLHDAPMRDILAAFTLTAAPAGRFEFRDDGRCAEVWEVRLSAGKELPS